MVVRYFKLLLWDAVLRFNEKAATNVHLYKHLSYNDPNALCFDLLYTFPRFYHECIWTFSTTWNKVTIFIARPDVNLSRRFKTRRFNDLSSFNVTLQCLDRLTIFFSSTLAYIFVKRSIYRFRNNWDLSAIVTFQKFESCARSYRESNNFSLIRRSLSFERIA